MKVSLLRATWSPRPTQNCFPNPEKCSFLLKKKEFLFYMSQVDNNQTQNLEVHKALAAALFHSRLLCFRTEIRRRRGESNEHVTVLGD